MKNGRFLFFLLGIGTLFVGCDLLGVSTLPKSTNSDLGSIAHDKGVLNPSFSPSITKYALVLDSIDTSVTIAGSPEDAKSSVSSPVELKSILVGREIPADIIVTAESGEKQTYSVTVVRTSPFSGSVYQSIPTTIDPISDTYVTTRITFSAGRVTMQSSLYKDDSTCTVSTSHIWDWTTEADVSVVEQLDGSYHMTMTVTSVTIAIVDSGTVDWDNQISLCGISDWALNVPRQVAGLELVSGVWIPDLNGVLLDRIEGSKTGFRTGNGYPPIVSSRFKTYPDAINTLYQFNEE